MSEELCIIIEVDEKAFRAAGLQLLEHSKWKPSQYPDYWYRIDPARPELNVKRHVTIAHKKHLKAKNKQVSWSDDTTRHDKKTFDCNFTGMMTAKGIARTVLGFSGDVQLEAVSELESLKRLIESAKGRESCEAVGYFAADIVLKATSSPHKSAGQKFLDLLE
jgi:hypothetical protein